MDDCAWHAMLYLICYEHTDDPDALARAAGMVRKTFEITVTTPRGRAVVQQRARLQSLYEVCLLLDTWQILKHAPDDA